MFLSLKLPSSIIHHQYTPLQGRSHIQTTSNPFSAQNNNNLQTCTSPTRPSPTTLGLSPSPVSLLRLAPLLSATTTLVWAYDQHFLLSLLTQPDLRAAGIDAHFPAYFANFFDPGVLRVLACTALTSLSALANWRRGGPAGSWYGWTGVFALGHLLFVPWVAPKVQGVLQAKEKGEAGRALEGWLRVNGVRSLTVDAMAWGPAVVAMGRVLEV